NFSAARSIGPAQSSAQSGADTAIVIRRKPVSMAEMGPGFCREDTVGTMKNSGTIRVGIGGWVFPPWRGAFYPPGLRQAEELAYASNHVSAIEINGTFYRIQTPASFKKWRDETPDDFVFSLKGPRFLTHLTELASAEPY